MSRNNKFIFAVETPQLLGSLSEILENLNANGYLCDKAYALMMNTAFKTEDVVDVLACVKVKEDSGKVILNRTPSPHVLVSPVCPIKSERSFSSKAVQIIKSPSSIPEAPKEPLNHRTAVTNRMFLSKPAHINAEQSFTIDPVSLFKERCKGLGIKPGSTSTFAGEEVITNAQTRSFNENEKRPVQDEKTPDLELVARVYSTIEIQEIPTEDEKTPDPEPVACVDSEFEIKENPAEDQKKPGPKSVAHHESMIETEEHPAEEVGLVTNTGGITPSESTTPIEYSAEVATESESEQIGESKPINQTETYVELETDNVEITQFESTNEGASVAVVTIVPQPRFQTLEEKQKANAWYKWDAATDDMARFGERERQRSISPPSGPTVFRDIYKPATVDTNGVRSVGKAIHRILTGDEKERDAVEKKETASSYNDFQVRKNVTVEQDDTPEEEISVKENIARSEDVPTPSGDLKVTTHPQPQRANISATTLKTKAQTVRLREEGPKTAKSFQFKLSSAGKYGLKGPTTHRRGCIIECQENRLGDGNTMLPIQRGDILEIIEERSNHVTFLVKQTWGERNMGCINILGVDLTRDQFAASAIRTSSPVSVTSAASAQTTSQSCSQSYGPTMTRRA